MIYISDYLAFWIFTAIEIVFLSVAILVARLIGSKKPNKTKTTIYECGQKPFGNANDYKILGITRYFGYAVVFFALDAFAWVILTAAMSINFTFEAIATVSVYILVVLVGIGYFLAELKRLVR
jgi:NADH:ubiquinone oxidoreductase subunit 3 (subunit A)